MTEILDWDVAAANNNAASPDGFPENMAYSGVNDSAREVMAAARRNYGIFGDRNLTSGTSSAFTVTLPVTLTSIPLGFAMIVEFHTNPDDNATINVNALGADDIWRDGSNKIKAWDISALVPVLLVQGTNGFYLAGPFQYRSSAFHVPLARCYTPLQTTYTPTDFVGTAFPVSDVFRSIGVTGDATADYAWSLVDSKFDTLSALRVKAYVEGTSLAAGACDVKLHYREGAKSWTFGAAPVITARHHAAAAGEVFSADASFIVPVDASFFRWDAGYTETNVSARKIELYPEEIFI